MKAIRSVTLGLLLAFFVSARADEPVNLAGGPPPVPQDVSEAHGRLDIDYVLIPPDKLSAFVDAFDSNSAIPDLDVVLKKFGGKIVASASTNLVLGGDGTMLEMADSRLTLRPRIVDANQFHLDGRITRLSFSDTFDVLLQPGAYQLFVAWDQPPHGGAKDPYNAVVARMREISVESPNGVVHTLTTGPGPSPEPTPAPEPVPGAIPPAPPPLPKSGKILYENRGDNTNGFVTGNGTPSFTPRDGMLVANDPASGCHSDAAGWVSLPVALPSDFQIDFDVRADANDAMSWLMLFDGATNKGILVCNRTNTSFGGPTLGIASLADVTSGDQIFWHHSADLAGTTAQKFPNQIWTHVTITKVGNKLIDRVGGQVITADLPRDILKIKLRAGLGYYATKNVGGNGQMEYANIRITPQL